MELYCGIDIAKDKHAVCIRNEKFDVVDKLEITNNLKGFQRFAERVPKSAVVGMEATGEYHKPLESWLSGKEYAVSVFNPRKTKNFAKVNHIVTKTDKVDAAMLAEFMAMGFHKTQKQWKNKYPELRQLTRARLALVTDQTRFKLRVLTRLAVLFPEYEKLFSESFGKSFTEVLAKYTSPESFANIPPEQLIAEISTASRGMLESAKALEIIDAAKNSVGIKNEAYAEEIRINIRYVSELEKDIKRLDRKIREQMKSIKQSITKLRGISTVSAASIIAEIGDVSQFKSRRALFNFTGMTPMIRESGKYNSRQMHMGKYGNKYLRTTLWLASISCINHNEEFKNYFIKKHYVDKKPKMTAVGAVCRKLTYRVYHIMKNEMS